MSKSLFPLSILLLSILHITAVHAKSEKFDVSVCAPRVPVIDLQRAINIASETLEHRHQLNNKYIDSAVLHCEDNKYRWIVGFRHRKYETGHYLIYVDMEGHTSSRIIKDG